MLGSTLEMPDSRCEKWGFGVARTLNASYTVTAVEGRRGGLQKGEGPKA